MISLSTEYFIGFTYGSEAARRGDSIIKMPTEVESDLNKRSGFTHGYFIEKFGMLPQAYADYLVSKWRKEYELVDLS